MTYDCKRCRAASAALPPSNTPLFDIQSKPVAVPAQEHSLLADLRAVVARTLSGLDMFAAPGSTTPPATAAATASATAHGSTAVVRRDTVVEGLYAGLPLGALAIAQVWSWLGVRCWLLKFDLRFAGTAAHERAHDYLPFTRSVDVAYDLICAWHTVCVVHASLHVCSCASTVLLCRRRRVQPQLQLLQRCRAPAAATQQPLPGL